MGNYRYTLIIKICTYCYRYALQQLIFFHQQGALQSGFEVVSEPTQGVFTQLSSLSLFVQHAKFCDQVSAQLQFRLLYNTGVAASATAIPVSMFCAVLRGVCISSGLCGDTANLMPK